MRNYINKFYENVKKYIKENYKYLIFLVLFTCFCFYDTGYSIYKPGGTINATNRVKGNNLYQSSGSFNMAYVSMVEGKLPFYLAAKVIPSWELVKNEKLTISNAENMEDVQTREHLQYMEAISNAMYVAFNKAGVPFEVSSNKYYVTYKSERNDSSIKIGDEVLSYDNISFQGLEEMKKYINSKKVGDKIILKYLTNKEEKESMTTIYEDNNKLYIGLSVLNLKEIKSDYNIKISSKNSESGPSGGLITTLAIYNALVPEDITRGKRIVGTGTMSLDGTVGEIGGIIYKLGTAVKKKADIFLCPKENYQEAIQYAKNKKYDIIIKDVATFDDAIKYLEALEEN